jgi:hypothetical protein
MEREISDCLFTCFCYSSIVKIEVVRSSETTVNSVRIHRLTSQKKMLIVITAIKP